jgi:hypothetical protein
VHLVQIDVVGAEAAQEVLDQLGESWMIRAAFASVVTLLLKANDGPA